MVVVSNSTNTVNQPVGATENAAGQLGFATNTISLSTTPQVFNARIDSLNSYDMSNFNFLLTVVDTTGGTSAPSGVTIIENALQDLTFRTKSGRTLFSLNGNLLDFYKMQHRLNNNGYYIASTAPADSSTSTEYTATYNFTFNNLCVPNKELPIYVTGHFNTLSSRATTLNSMTSTAQLSCYIDQVPVAKPYAQIVATSVTQSATGSSIAITPNIDSANILDFSLDVGADSNLGASNSFNVSQNNQQLIPNATYTSVTAKENSTYPSSTHISGFFPLSLMVQKPLNNVTAKVAAQMNLTSTPTVNGNSDTYRIYQIELYQ